MKQYPELTEEEVKELERHNDFLKRVNRYRAKHGITWGGPPYSRTEYRYARRGELIRDFLVLFAIALAGVGIVVVLLIGLFG